MDNEYFALSYLVSNPGEVPKDMIHLMNRIVEVESEMRMLTNTINELSSIAIKMMPESYIDEWAGKVKGTIK